MIPADYPYADRLVALDNEGTRLGLMDCEDEVLLWVANKDAPEEEDTIIGLNKEQVQSLIARLERWLST